MAFFAEASEVDKYIGGSSAPLSSIPSPGRS